MCQWTVTEAAADPGTERRDRARAVVGEGGAVAEAKAVAVVKAEAVAVAVERSTVFSSLGSANVARCSLG